MNTEKGLEPNRAENSREKNQLQSKQQAQPNMPEKEQLQIYALKF